MFLLFNIFVGNVSEIPKLVSGSTCQVVGFVDSPIQFKLFNNTNNTNSISVKG